METGSTVGPTSLPGEERRREVAQRRGEELRELIRYHDYRYYEAIPEVVGPVLSRRPEGSRPWSFPAHCPSCGTRLVREPGEVDWRCPNRSGCPSQALEWLFHFASRGAMDIEPASWRA